MFFSSLRRSSFMAQKKIRQTRLNKIGQTYLYHDSERQGTIPRNHRNIIKVNMLMDQINITLILYGYFN